MGSNAASSGSSDRPMTVRSVVAPKKKNPIVEFVKSGGIAGAVIRGVSGAIKNANTKSKQNKMDYEGQAAGVTPMGSSSNFIGGNGRNNNNSNAVVPLTTAAAMSPTTAEVAQATATDATDTTSSENILLKKKKAKATGRSSTILTSSKGVTSDQGLTLGKKSLLGA